MEVCQLYLVESPVSSTSPTYHHYRPSHTSIHPAEHNTVVMAWRAASRKPSHHHQLISPATRTKTHSTCGKPLAEYPYNWSLNRVDCNGQHCTSLYCWKNTFINCKQFLTLQKTIINIHITPLSSLALRMFPHNGALPHSNPG